LKTVYFSRELSSYETDAAFPGLGNGVKFIMNYRLILLIYIFDSSRGIIGVVSTENDLLSLLRVVKQVFAGNPFLFQQPCDSFKISLSILVEKTLSIY
jgi:hypothetical protein